MRYNRRLVLRRSPEFENPLRDLVDNAITELFRGEQAFMEKALSRIVIANQRLDGTMNAFRYNGERFANIESRYLKGVEIKPLHASLEPEIEAWIQQRAQLEKDITRIRNAFSAALARCRHKQDFRDVLPESLVSLIPELQGMPRMNEEGHNLRENPMLHAQFLEGVELILQYQANRLIFT